MERLPEDLGRQTVEHELGDDDYNEMYFEADCRVWSLGYYESPEDYESPEVEVLTVVLVNLATGQRDRYDHELIESDIMAIEDQAVEYATDAARLSR